MNYTFCLCCHRDAVLVEVDLRGEGPELNEREHALQALGSVSILAFPNKDTQEECDVKTPSLIPWRPLQN